MVALRTHHDLVHDLERLATVLEGLDLVHSDPIHKLAPAKRDRLVRAIRSYLIGNLTHPDRPLCVVFAGPTGSGKSTLVNTLSGLTVSETGPLRPTTKDPVVLCSPADRTTFEMIGGVGCEVVTGRAPILSRMALVDTPDIDSTELVHRELAERLIDCADLVVFVTSALRYADAAPWEVLRRAVSRGAPVIHVLNRLTADSAGAVMDLGSRLDSAGLEGDIVRVPEHHIGPASHTVPALAVRDLQRRLVELAKDRDEHRRAVFNRVLDSVATQTGELAELAAVFEAERSAVADQIRRGFEVSRADVVAGVVDHLSIEEAPAGRWRLWRWERANRLNQADLARFEGGVGECLIAVVEADIRLASTPLDALGVDSLSVQAGARPAIESAVGGWFDYVRSLASRVEEANRGLAASVLIGTALGGPYQTAIGALFGIDRDLMVGLAREGLRDRLGAVYTRAAETAIRSWRPWHDEVAGDVVRDRLTRVIVKSQFADA